MVNTVHDTRKEFFELIDMACAQHGPTKVAECLGEAPPSVLRWRDRKVENPHFDTCRNAIPKLRAFLNMPLTTGPVETPVIRIPSAIKIAGNGVVENVVFKQTPEQTVISKLANRVNELEKMIEIDTIERDRLDERIRLNTDEKNMLTVSIQAIRKIG